MTKSPTRESPPQPSEQPQPRRRRNVYDYDGEYEFSIVQHWTALGVPAPSAPGHHRPGTVSAIRLAKHDRAVSLPGENGIFLLAPNQVGVL
jgi:hypothetical protein